MSWQSLLVAGVAGTKPLTALVRRVGRGGLESATADSFSPLVGRTLSFRESPSEGSILPSTVAMKLVSVTRHEHISRLERQIPELRGKRKRESFSLLFELSGSKPLGTGLHEFTRGEFKGCPVLLSRVASASKTGLFHYEAIFG